MTITETLKEYFTKQNVIATGDTIADILKSGFSQLNGAEVSGNQIADIIEQCTETGTFPSGGAVPTVVKEITWDGDTEGLESYEVTLPGDEPVTVTMYKVSDSVLPYGFFDSADGYTYEGTDQSDDPYTYPKVYAFDGYVALGGAFDVISAYFDNFVSEAFGDEVLVPSIGTWFKKDGTSYLKSITAELEI